MVLRWGRVAVLAAVVSVMAATAAVADGMPPEYADPGYASWPPPVAEPAPPVVAAPPAPVSPPALPTLPVAPARAEAFTVTFAEVVGYLSRVGYEDVKRSASLYCAHYGRTAKVDVRFRVEADWYVRFKCLPLT